LGENLTYLIKSYLFFLKIGKDPLKHFAIDTHIFYPIDAIFRDFRVWTNQSNCWARPRIIGAKYKTIVQFKT
jgi:hypothetical protein